MKKPTTKIIGALFFLFSLILVSNKLRAQEIRFNKSYCKEFLAANELYLINSPVNSIEFKTSKGQKFTFEELVQKNWPSKKIIKIDEKDFNKLKGLNDKFHIRIASENHTSTNMKYGYTSDRGSTDAIEIMKGKVKYNFRYVYWFQIDLQGFMNGIATERLIYSVENIKSMVENYVDKSIRDELFYKSVGYKEILQSDTLYVKPEDLYWPPELLKKAYPFNFRLVNKEQWIKAISDARPNLLFLDYVRGRGESYFNTANIYQAKNGKLIVSLYPLKGFGHTLTKPDLKKLSN